MAEPRTLISRSQTRWSMAYDMIVRAVLLREFFSFLSVMTRRDPFSASAWTLMIQSVAFLRLFKSAIVACQSRKQLIGAHITHIQEIVTAVKEPKFQRILVADFKLNADQLNDSRVYNIGAILDAPAETEGGLPHPLRAFTTLATTDHRSPDLNKLITQLDGQLTLRLNADGTGKHQLNRRAPLTAVSLCCCISHKQPLTQRVLAVKPPQWQLFSTQASRAWCWTSLTHPGRLLT